ncbi:MAG: ester cyclase [Verrucomicrobia bacterium]|nr:ester cyclase [Verrucomicrobiota bacterium]
MIPQESVLPRALLTYIEGLKTRDVDLIGSTFADDIRFVTPAKTMRREEILEFLAALYRGFPDWSYDHDEPVVNGEGIYGVKWRQGGTHTGVLTFSGFKAVLATGKRVTIPEQFFYYQVRNKKLSEIRPDPVLGGAPRGIFEQIGVELPPL